MTLTGPWKVVDGGSCEAETLVGFEGDLSCRASQVGGKAWDAEEKSSSRTAEIVCYAKLPRAAPSD